jgi:hypothetical protein
MAKASPPPPVARPAQPPPTTQQPNGQNSTPRTFSVLSGRQDAAQRVVLYGPGGIGKSTLASLAPGNVFVDLEGGTREMDVPRIEGIESFADLRAALQSDVFDEAQTITLDTATRAQELAEGYMLETIPNEKGKHVSSIEGYGFSRGFTHLYDTFLLLLADLDRQVRAGRHVILIAHDCIADVPNPAGEDFIRYEPHFQAPKSGKASIRNRVVQWADHALFVGYDVISEDGKGKGGGTRTIWPSERPDHVAKSRRIADPLPFTSTTDDTIWNLILKGGVQ